MSKAALKFKNMTIGKQQGELARLRVVGGPDHGSVFIITSARVTIGRGEESDIILTDLKASRRHFELLMDTGVPVIKDLGSSHGVLVNGVVSKQVVLKTGDKLGVGETVMEFISSGAGGGATQMIFKNPSVAAVVGTGTSGLTQFIQRPGVSGAAGAQAGGKPQTFFERNKRLIVMLGVLMFLATMLPEVEKKRAKKKYLDPVALEAERAAGGLAPPVPDGLSIKNSESYFKEGFREYRAKNYLRAQAAFETALQIWGEHNLARIYLDSTKKAIENEAKEHLVNARRDEDANRLRGAQMHYEAIKRMFMKDQSNPLFKEADARSFELQRKIKEAERSL